MSTTVTNPDLLEIAQKSVTLFSGIKDDLAAVTVAFGDMATYNDTVKIATISAGDNSTEADYSTDGGSSIVFRNVTLNARSKQQVELTEAEYAKVGDVVTAAVFNALVAKAAKGATDAVYGLINTTNFPISTNKIVTSAAESALDLDKIYAAVGSALALGIFDPASIKVVCPFSTYARLKSDLDKRYSAGISLNFQIVPNALTSVSYITDGSAAGIAFGGDPGTNKTTMVSDGIGYSLKVFNNDIKDKVVIAPRFTYGVSLLGGPIRWLQSA